MSDDRDVFVGPDGSTTTISAPVLGHTKYTCNQCGHGWDYGQANCSKCGSLIFDAVEVPPSLITRVAGRIMGIETTPAKPVVKPADPADTAALRALAAAGHAYADALVAGDAAARRIVRAEQGTSGTTGYVQAKLSVAVDTVSDFALFNLGQLYKPVLGISDMIETALAELEQEVTA